MTQQHQHAEATPLLSRGLVAVLLAQFLSAFADNAILVGALKLVMTLTAEKGMDALLQGSFVLPYILLAPFVGLLADALPKGRVMWLANSVKLLSGLAMLAVAWLGTAEMVSWVIVAYVLTGIGAALYSPAKYGILVQLCRPAHLVSANGLIEGSTIVAILLGFVVGGLLADVSLLGLLVLVTVCYALAVGLSLLIPRLPVVHPFDGASVITMVRGFASVVLTLFTDRQARISLLGTSLFWGAGSTLRLVLFAWVPFALALTNTSAATNLGGIVSVGIIIGAALAGTLVRLEQAPRALWAGLLIGLPLLFMGWVSTLWQAAALLVAVGVAAGFFVVPLNALLQARGQQSVGAGRAIAVQNFCENLLIAAFVGIHYLASQLLDPGQEVLGFGLLMITLMGALFISYRLTGRTHQP
ncbi:lysophospholipid transporter LplT [Aeromonas cavernicola]|uniref:Lysophospholipid transporter LplT n=1 Tax=Aeromonas cavernicola TaxID=1006623 RepID=A0A2H9U2S5_9GAMM|nr:lysophospholipid transporter LplT [Aeromonas cavernicola]PJG58352.1 lysophospholipid transporter LplT [Aeromonas cavernicola]